MPWCPKCKSEYREGITECADCKIPLVDELPVQEISEAEYTVNYDEQQTLDEIPESEDTKQQTVEKSAGVYQDKKAKAEDFKSSAYTLLLVGIVGIVALVLMESGVLPIRLAAPGKYITYTVMGGMFLIFIITGIASFRSSKKYEGEAKAEDEQTATIKTWAMEHLTMEKIQNKAADRAEGTSIEDLPQEMQYFHYYAVLKDAVIEQFGELDAAYLDALCEEIYSMIFDNH